MLDPNRIVMTDGVCECGIFGLRPDHDSPSGRAIDRKGVSAMLSILIDIRFNSIFRASHSRISSASRASEMRGVEMSICSIW
jgi:hypothetical protein